MTDQLFDLTGKIALVTGGSRGLGLAMAEAFAAHGADVIIASRKLENCESAAARLRDTYGVRALPIASNVSHWDDCDALVERAYEAFGRVDVLVNNAGLSPLYPSLDQVSEALWDKVLAINLKGPFRLGALVGTRMAAGAGGSIINISSAAAIRPKPTELPYAAAKVGLNALTEGFSKAFGPTVRVNTIQPGPFLTDVSQAWDLERFAERARTSISLQRGGEPSEIVGAALFFASAASSFCTGAILRVDGGIH